MFVSVATLVSGGLILGVSLGLWAGYKRGKTDYFILRVGDIFHSVPTILLLLIINASLQDRIGRVGGRCVRSDGDCLDR